MVPTVRKLISMREYARRRGVSPAAVRKAVMFGRITLTDGRVDPARADREWAANSASGNWGGKR